MNYSRFDVEDFAADDYFIRWVSQNDQEAEKFWTLFISLHPEVKPKIDQARILVLNLKHQSDHNADADQKVEAIWDGIQNRMKSSEESSGGRSVHINIILGIAASVAAVVLFVAGIYLSYKKPSVPARNFTESSPVTKDFVEKINDTENPIRIRLSDGSIVHLEKNSRLVYKDDYQGDVSRHVFLRGEAFFEVTKNPRQPFFVHANEVVTKVLGTSFNVRAYDDAKDITVSVTSGKVSVFSPQDEKTTLNDVQAEINGVILLPNQQVVYQRDQESFDKTLVEAPVVLSPSITDSNFIFENASIPGVFHALEEAYGIEIIFDEEVMKTCFITAPLGTEPLFEKLKIICRTIGANYEIIDTRVVINSSGCL